MVDTMRDRRCRGITLFETVVTLVILGSLLATFAPLLRLAALQRAAAEERQFAQLEISNILERLTARDWEDITTQSAGSVELSAISREMLRDAELSLEVSEASPPPEAKRIVVELRWKNRADEFAAPARLTTWVYKREN